MAQILILSPTFPGPLKSGGQVRLFQVIHYMTQHHHKVSLLTFLLPDQAPFLKEIQQLCYRTETVPGRIEPSFLRKLRGRFNLLELRRFMLKIEQSVRGVPYHYCRFAHPEMTRLLRQMVTEDNYDFIQAEYSQMAPYLMDPIVQKSGARTILVEIDVNSIATERTSQYSRGWKRTFYRYDAARMVSYERKILTKVFKVITMSEEDAYTVHEICPEAATCVVPNGVDVSYYTFSHRKDTARDLLFIGGSRHLPNVDAMEFFSTQILPRINAERPDITLTVIGEFHHRTGQYPPAICFQGYAEDLRPYLASHLVFVVPLRIGSGTRLKILEALAAGIPVISTRVGAEGLHVQHEKDILIADSAEDFAKAILRLLEDPGLGRRIAEHARETAVSMYTWGKVLSPLEHLYRSVSTAA